MGIERDKFWLVWRENGGVPTCKHYDKASAEREAERLAKAHPGVTFFVLKATEAAVADDAPVRWGQVGPYGNPVVRTRVMTPSPTPEPTIEVEAS